MLPHRNGSICLTLDSRLSAGHIFIELLIGCHIISLLTTKSVAQKGTATETEMEMEMEMERKDISISRAEKSKIFTIMSSGVVASD